MDEKQLRRNHVGSLLKFWAFWLSSFYCVVGFFGVLILQSAVQDDGGEPHILLSVLGGLFTGFAVIAVTAFVGLLFGQVWSRSLLMIVSFAALIGFPVGTGFGIMVLIELFHRSRKASTKATQQTNADPKTEKKG